MQFTMLQTGKSKVLFPKTTDNFPTAIFRGHILPFNAVFSRHSRHDDAKRPPVLNTPEDEDLDDLFLPRDVPAGFASR
jgi:hypothetical protein